MKMDEKFPWYFVKKVTFYAKHKKATFEFTAGFSLDANPETIEKWDSMLRGAALYLDKDQQVYEP